MRMRSFAAAMSDSGDRSPQGSAEPRRLSLGHYSRIYRRQNRRILPTGGPAAAALEEKQSSAAQSSTQQEFVTPAITVTQPEEEQLENEEVSSEVPLPEEEKGSGEEEDEEEEKQPRQGARSFSIPHGSLATVRPGRLPPRTVLTDRPILEEEDDEEAEEDRDEEEEAEEKREESGDTQRSRWGHSRSRALSYPVYTSGGNSGLQAMLKVARHQPLQLVTGVGGEEEEDEEKEEEGKASGGASDTKSKDDSSLHEPQSAMGQFVQMALMAKKWKNRTKEEATSSRTSRENLCDRQRRRPMVEIPRSLKLEVLEEAHQIVHKTLQKYRSELGLCHKLTLQAEQHCETLAQQLGNHISTNSTH